MNKHKKLTIFLCGWPIIVTVLSWFFTFNFLISSILLFGVPAVVLSALNSKSILRVLIFSAVFSFVGGFIFEYFGALDNSWYIPSFLPHLYGSITFEAQVWSLLLTYCTLMFYENFYDHSRHKLLGSRMHYFLPVFSATLVIFIIALTIYGKIFKINYFYFWGILALLVVPAITFLIDYPRYIKRVLKVAMYFFAVGMLQEVIALTKGYWYFPGQHFIGWVHIGSLRFPYEELFFWMIAFTAGVISYFEFYDDNRIKLSSSKAAHVFNKKY